MGMFATKDFVCFSAIPLFLCYALWKVNAISTRLERVEFECLGCWPCRTTVVASSLPAMRFKSKIRTPTELKAPRVWRVCVRKAAWHMCQDMQNIDDLKTVLTSSLPKISHEAERLQQRWKTWLVDDVPISSVIAFCDEVIKIEGCSRLRAKESTSSARWRCIFVGLRIVRISSCFSDRPALLLQFRPQPFSGWQLEQGKPRSFPCAWRHCVLHSVNHCLQKVDCWSI